MLGGCVSILGIYSGLRKCAGRACSRGLMPVNTATKKSARAVELGCHGAFLAWRDSTGPYASTLFDKGEGGGFGSPNAAILMRARTNLHGRAHNCALGWCAAPVMPLRETWSVSEAHCPFMIRTEHLLQMALNISGDTLRRVVTIGATVLVRTGSRPKAGRRRPGLSIRTRSRRRQGNGRSSAADSWVRGRFRRGSPPMRGLARPGDSRSANRCRGPTPARPTATMSTAP